MAKSSKSQFIGAAGTYYVMARLAYEGIHAACTFGNAPSVDILVSSPDGERSIAVQVKTAAYARRPFGDNKEVTNFDWVLKYKAVQKGYENLFFIFVDLWGKKCEWSKQEERLISWQPTVYVLPSKDLVEKCKDWDEAYWRFQPEVAFMSKYEERWDLLKGALKGPYTFPAMN
jgi:hypothetical protein